MGRNFFDLVGKFAVLRKDRVETRRHQRQPVQGLQAAQMLPGRNTYRPRGNVKPCTNYSEAVLRFNVTMLFASAGP
jgi:hypothetical protein